MDADLLRVTGTVEGSQESYPARHRQHVRLHREGDRPPRRARHAAQQPQGAGATKQVRPHVHTSTHL